MQFTALDTKYYIQVFSDSIGNYGLLAANDSITEFNPIGQNLPIGVNLAGYIDYTSDVDKFAFSAVAGRVYGFTLQTAIPDAFLDIEYLNVQVSNLVSKGSGSYVFTAGVSGIFDLHISSNSFVNRGAYTIGYVELDVTPPIIIASAPAISAIGVNWAQNIAVEFSELVQPGSGTITIRNTGTGVIHEAFNVSTSSNVTIAGSTLTINPSADLIPGTQYRVEFSADSVRDYAANPYGGSSIFTFTTAAAAANLPPTSTNGTGTTSEDTALTAQLPAAVDPEGNAIAYAKVSNPAHGVVTVGTNGSYTYSPSPNYAGGDSLGFSVADTGGGSNLYTVTLTITPVNDLPGGSVTVAGSAQIFQMLAAISTLTDVEGMGTLSYQWLRAGTAINGATSGSYELGTADIGSTISARVSYTDGAGTFESVTSSATSAVAGYNMVIGTFEPDILIGTSAADRIDGLGGNDQLRGGAGKDDLNGGSGIDVAAYDSARIGVSFVSTFTGYTVTSSLLDGIDTLSNIERLKFPDISVALDLSGNAGTVAKILGAVFGRDAVFNEEYAGIGLYFMDGGMSYASLMQLAIDARLGPGASHQAVVDLLYTNVVGVPPGDADRAYFVGLLDTNVYTVASLGVMAADIDLNLVNIDLVGLAQQGLEYAPYAGG